EGRHRRQCAGVVLAVTVAAETTGPKALALRARRQHDDLGANRCALVEVDDILVDHADAAGGNALPDGPWLDRAVDPIERVFGVLPKVHGARAQRIARATRHADAARQLAHLPHELRLARQHLPGRIPVRPFLLLVDGRHARPAETLAADADPIAHRPSAALHQ